MFATRLAEMGMGRKAFRDRFILLLALLALSTRCCHGANADGEHAPKEQGQLLWHCQNNADVALNAHGNNGYTNLPFIQFEPVVRGGKVFWAVVGHTPATPGKGGESRRRILTVCAADCLSGKALWRAEIETGYDMFQGLAPVDKVLWVLLERKAMQLDMNSGNIGKQLSLSVQSMPVVDGRQGFFASSRGMVAFNFDGEGAAWKSETTPFGACGFPPPTLDKEQAYYVHPTRSEVLALDRRTGAEEWSTGLRWGQSGVTVDQNHVFATSHSDLANTQRCSLHKLNKVDGKELGKIALPAKRPARNAAFQPYIDDSYVYVVQPASFSVLRKADLQVVFGHDHDSAGQAGEVGCSYVARPIPFGRDILLTVRRCTLSMHSGTGIHRGDSTIYYVFSPMEKRFTARSAMLRGAPLSAPSIHTGRIYQTTEEGGVLCYDFRSPNK